MILYNNNYYEYDNYVNILDCKLTVILLPSTLVSCQHGEAIRYC